MPASPTILNHGPATASRSTLRLRHKALIASFFLIVMLPVLVSAAYLWGRATDQYASMLGFSVHREDASSALAMMTGLASISGVSGSSDTDIIYNYVFSQSVVAEIQQEIDLVAMWSKPEGDPIFAYDPTGTIEDLVDYWKDMVSVSYDNSTGLIEVRVLAFDPDDARRIATAIFEKSGVMINNLNEIAKEDAVAFARNELETARENLVEARQEMTAFRNRYQLVDPTADLATNSTIVGTLEQELAQAMIDYDLIRTSAPAEDPRLMVLDRRIKVIEQRIQAERAKIGDGAKAGDGRTMAEVVADYERLAVDREFAETSYNAARAAYESSRAEAMRTSRYLAAHVLPTHAESSRFPERGKLLATIAVFLVMLWGVMALVYYSLRDRR